jgi:hypothetical protein
MIGSWKYEGGLIDKTFKFLYHLIKKKDNDNIHQWREKVEEI